jgi:hypothetical protein
VIIKIREDIIAAAAIAFSARNLIDLWGIRLTLCIIEWESGWGDKPSQIINSSIYILTQSAIVVLRIVSLVRLSWFSNMYNGIYIYIYILSHNIWVLYSLMCLLFRFRITFLLVAFFVLSENSK